MVGGTALSGGRGSLFGTLLGVLVITLIGNGLVLLGINSFSAGEYAASSSWWRCWRISC
ncbi:hypothetical protein ACLK1V_13890 [Escherichia coli]